MYQYCAQCNCGHVSIGYSSPQDISSCISRKCDCDYCVQRGIEYLSDPQGQITVTSTLPLLHEKQGSEQASFLLCSNCQTVMGVCYIDADVSVGSVNISIFEKFKLLQGSTTVSPKRLDRVEKIKRWCNLWSQLTFTKH